jgi:hypothetical protein
MKTMEAKEFRIGNLINYRIVDKMDERQEWLEVSEIDYDDLRIFGIKDKIDNDYQPIPLTEEWLLKFGIKNANFIHEIKPQIVHIYSINKWFFAINEDGNIRMLHPVNEINIKYVHQLQNLYFALTGTELEYNERK